MANKIKTTDPWQSLLDLGYRLTLFKNHVGTYTARLHTGTFLNHHQKPRHEFHIDGRTPAEALRRLAAKIEAEDGCR